MDNDDELLDAFNNLLLTDDYDLTDSVGSSSKDRRAWQTLVNLANDPKLLEMLEEEDARMAEEEADERDNEVG